MVISLPEQAEYGNTKSRIAVSSFRTETTSLKWKRDGKKMEMEIEIKIKSKVKIKLKIRTEINIEKKTLTLNYKIK